MLRIQVKGVIKCMGSGTIIAWDDSVIERNGSRSYDFMRDQVALLAMGQPLRNVTKINHPFLFDISHG
ncbi:hypothetical protein D9M71_700430 [compost metagenome]